MGAIQDWLRILMAVALSVISTRLFMRIAEAIGRMLGLGDLVISTYKKVFNAVKAKE